MVNRLKAMLKDFPCRDWKVMVKEENTFYLPCQKKAPQEPEESSLLSAQVTLFQDSVSDDQTFRGSASTTLFPSMSDAEMRDALDKLLAEAQQIHEPWYPLASPLKNVAPFHENSVFDRHDLSHWTSSLADAVYKADRRTGSWVKELHIRLTDVRESFFNSQGVDLQFSGYRGSIDLLTAASPGDGKDYELYKQYLFSAYEPEDITRYTATQLSYTEDRAKAVPMESIPSSVSIILKEEAVPVFFSFWRWLCDGENICSLEVPYSIGDQPINSRGDSISLIGLSRLYNSAAIRPFDNDGVILKEQQLIDQGRVVKFHSGIQYSHYLNSGITGKYNCFSVLPGSLSAEALYHSPYLEIVSFKDFYMDEDNGEFGGHIQLAYWYDGKNSKPVTGGTLSGSLTQSVPLIRMTETVIQQGNFLGPEALLLDCVTLEPQ